MGIGWRCAGTIIIIVAVLSAAASAANDRPLIFGMNPMPAEWSGHDGDQYWWEQVQYDRMKQAGCTSVRVGLGWDLVEPNPGDRNWGDIDDDLKKMMDRGFEPVLLIVATPTWALLPGQGTPFYPAQLQYRAQFEKFVYDVARKFRGRVKYYEFWNEPNGWGWNRDPDGNTYSKAEEYVPWLIHGNSAVKRGDPNALWAIGGLDDNSGYGDYYLDKCYRYLARGHFDAVCEHPYSSATADLWKLDDLRTTMNNYGDDLPIWITELGWPANGRESQVAGWITDYFTRLSSDNYDFCKIATYHTSTDFTAEPVGFGLMNYDLQPKATYYAFQNFPKPARATINGTPAVSLLGPAKVKITFNTTIAATAQIMYGTTIGYGMVTPRTTTPTTSHMFEIDGLLPGTAYNYRIRMGAGEYADNFSANYQFTTPAGAVVDLVGNVTVTNVTTDSATISWKTSVPATGEVEYGLDYNYSSVAASSGVGTTHSVTLTGLEPFTAYQVRIRSMAAGYGTLLREIDTIVTDRVPGVLENGGFESNTSKQPWVVYGRMDGRVTGVSYHGFSARTGDGFFGSFASYDHKSGGCYQEVGAVPGQHYRATAWTRSMQSAGTPGDNAARLGIDPIGGTDPYADSIIWGNWTFSSADYVQMECSAFAESDKITVYIDIRQPYSYEWNINVVDDVELTSIPTTSVSLGDAKAAAVGTSVLVDEAVCTANFGDHAYVQSIDGASALRLNGNLDAKQGDIITFWGKASFTGPQKSIDGAGGAVIPGDATVKPFGMLSRDLGGQPLPGQVDMVANQSGVNTLNAYVTICGRITDAGEGYCYLDDGSGITDAAGNKGVKIIFADPGLTLLEGMIISVWGIVETEQVGGVWTPVIRQVGASDFSIHGGF